MPFHKVVELNPWILILHKVEHLFSLYANGEMDKEFDKVKASLVSLSFLAKIFMFGIASQIDKQPVPSTTPV